MRIRARRGDIAKRKAEALALALPEDSGPLSGAARAVDRASRGAISALFEHGDFRGRFLQSAVLYPRGLGAPRLILVGLGAVAELDPRRILQAAAILARRARDLRVTRMVTAIPDVESSRLSPPRTVQTFCEGLVLGDYRFAAYRREPTTGTATVEIVAGDSARARALEAPLERGARWAEATCVARDLAWTPGQDLTPEHLADRARDLARGVGARVEVLGVPQLERLGMGALLGVGRGSVHPPRLIVLEHRPRSARRDPVVVIGKGITFDTGGISLKPRENMHKMKYDMSGAAAVLGLFSALPTLDLAFPVIGVVASAENMPGGRALKPGDVVRAMDGTTIEVTNTDAEGRLVLADALVYARRFEPAAVVDLATLTGAVSIALGNLAAGLFTDDDTLADELTQAAVATGERLWRLPAWDEYLTDLRSDVADLVNSSGAREGGAILGAVFLKHFARGMRWAHLDIASTAWSPTERPHESRGPTGFGTRLLLEWISRRASAQASTSSSPAVRRARRATRSPRA